MKNHLIKLAALLILASCTPTPKQTSTEKKYEANWSSLRTHQMPQWLDGMKFGIYCHWGAQTAIIASGNKDMSYVDAIDQWTGENYDAKEWVDLFQAAGAQFAGPVAWHCTGVVNWDSDITEWNSANKGPKVDIYGSLAAELRKRNMPIISSFHTSKFWDTMWGQLTLEDKTVFDPREDNSAFGLANDGRQSAQLMDAWYARISEAIDKYQPDLVWFDTGFGGTVPSELRGHSTQGRLLPTGDQKTHCAPEHYQQKIISHFFNKGIEWNKEVQVIYKSHDIPVGVGMRNIEDGNLIGLQYDPWMADINIQRHIKWPSPWFYNPVNTPKDANTLVDMLIDMTSKNGRMLLNVPPMVDGTFSEAIKKELYAMGAWLKLNGEAIYGTQPWTFFGEGPNEVTNPGHHGQGKKQGNLIPKYTSEDIRFTQKGKTLYAIVMDWPGEKAVIRTLNKMGKLHPGDIQSVELIGAKEKVSWTQDENALVVDFPTEKPCDFAYVLKIERK